MDRKRLEKSDRTGQPDDLREKQVSCAMTHLQSNDLGFLPTTGGMKRSTELPVPDRPLFSRRQLDLAPLLTPHFLDRLQIPLPRGRAKYNAYSQEEDRDIYKGLTFWSPNVNIFRDPRWGRGHETYGEDPYLTKELGVSFVKGLQGDGEVMKAAACAKHFAVHSGPEAIRHEF